MAVFIKFFKILILPFIFLMLINFFVFFCREYHIGFSYQQTKSMPIGLYFYMPKTKISRGDDILFKLDVHSERFMVERGYILKPTNLLKRVVAISGDMVCYEKGGINIVNPQNNFHFIIQKYQEDTQGRKLPSIIDGCRLLKKGEYFVIGISSKYSFDSRYFGIIKNSQIIGKAFLLWS